MGDEHPANMSLRLWCRSEANASDLQQSLNDMFPGHMAAYTPLLMMEYVDFNIVQ